jgi:hypothetical protein
VHRFALHRIRETGVAAANERISSGGLSMESMFLQKQQRRRGAF